MSTPEHHQHKRKRDHDDDEKEEKEERRRVVEENNTNNSLLAQLHRERNQRRPPIERATLTSSSSTTMMSKNAKVASSLVAKSTTTTTTTRNTSAWANVGRLSSIAKSDRNNKKQAVNNSHSDEVERVLERAKQLERKQKTTKASVTTTRLLPKIETKTVEMPTRGRKWTEEPAIPDRTANGEEEVRILSYNIWFDNQAAQMARTEYLGRVIESCDPDE